jgi:hypothetical protein
MNLLCAWPQTAFSSTLWSLALSSEIYHSNKVAFICELYDWLQFCSIPQL